MSSPILVTGNRILVERLKAKEKTSGGLFIADTAKEKPSVGKVVGHGDLIQNQWLRKPVLVMFGKYSGIEQEVGGKAYLILKEEEVIGIVADHRLAETFELEGA